MAQHERLSYFELPRIDSFKLACIGEELVNKVEFLKKIVSENDDSQSELAGHEINKLLTKQEDLEFEYLGLIEKRKQLKGFSNKDKLEDAQKEIKDRAKKIKESTKKICRLFKDNKTVSDTDKIKKDMDFIKRIFAALQTDLTENQSFKQFNDDVFGHLRAQDALRNKQ